MFYLGTFFDLTFFQSPEEQAAGTVTGSLDATEGADVAAFAGDVLIDGPIAATEGADSAAFTGLVLIQGGLSCTEGADSAVFAGTVTGEVVVEEVRGSWLSEKQLGKLRKRDREFQKRKKRTDDLLQRAMERIANGESAGDEIEAAQAEIDDIRDWMNQPVTEEEDEEDIEMLLLLT